MSWNARQDFLENTFYHIYNRGLMKQTVFWNVDQFEKIYSLLVLYSKEYPNIKIISYAFLPNHFHFVIKNTKEGKELSDFMKKLQGRYSTWYRIKYPIEHKQPVFEGRFKAKKIDTEKYLYQCITYVNYNPVKHEIVKNIENYPYTSFHQLVDKKKFKEVPVPQLDELEM